MPAKSTQVRAGAFILVGLTAFVLGGLTGSVAPRPAALDTGRMSATLVPSATPLVSSATERAPSPFAGVWLMPDPVRPEDPPYLLTFAADGTLRASTIRRDESVSHGTWTATGEGAVSWSLVRLRLGEIGRYAGVMRLDGTSELDETGEAFTGILATEMIIADEFQVPPGPFVITGIRLLAGSATPGASQPARP
jgi:hypothetical protein